MSGSVLVTEDGELILGTWILSKHYKIYHYQLKNLVYKHARDLAELGDTVRIGKKYFQMIQQREKVKQTRGRPVQEFVLNGRQALFLLVILGSMDDPKRIIKAIDNEELKRIFKDLIKK